MDLREQSIYVAGHRGMVGSAVVRRLREEGFGRLLLKTRAELDLLRQEAVERFFEKERPDVVIMAAARVGGIHANSSFPAEFIQENLAMAMHVIQAAWRFGTGRLLFLGSSCIYPRLAPQPMPEECLLTSPLETTNEAYALAKIAGLKMCQHYRRQYGVLFHSVMPTNLYGPGDNYHPDNSHVLPALIRRFTEAKESGAQTVTLWGTGRPRREFLHVDDLAAAITHLLRLDNPPDWINAGTGQDVTIAELAELIRQAIGLEAQIVYDPSKPDGTPRKLLDVSKIHATGWRHRISWEEGIRRTIQAFQTERAAGAIRS